MKKLLYFVAAATFCFIACQKEVDLTESAKTNNGDTFTFKASIEQLANPTKGTIDADNGLVWAKDDKIGIYFRSWNDANNQAFTLVGDGGGTEGEFSRDASGEYEPSDATVAFYPWQGTGSDKNNVYDDPNDNPDKGPVMYFKLQDAYWGYTSGKMLTPLVASISSSSDIHFKHAGAAVKVTINNVPARVHSIGMSVDGQQITGNYSVNPANAGTDALTRVGEASTTKNTVWLNLWNGEESKWDFIFPVPELTKPKLSFQMWDENDILVWSKSSKALATDLSRGDILVMPELTITPYKQFSVSSDWTFCGTINGSAWVNDIPMYTDGTVCILRGITFKEGDIFKIRKNKNWDDEVYPGKEENETWNVTNDNKGTKDVWFNTSTHEITLKDAKCPYPAPKVTLYFGINTSGGTGIALRSDDLAPGYSWPGRTLTQREFIGNKWYYKYEVDGGTVWGKSISGVSIVGIDSWNTSSSTLDFSKIKTTYYFEATSGVVISEPSSLPSDPEHQSISVGTDLEDWDDVIGVTNGNHTVKVESDKDNIYVYSARTNASGDYDGIWGNSGYVYVLFDLDNDPSTYDHDQWGKKGEFVVLLYPYAGSSATPAFNTSKTDKWVYGPTSGYTINNIELYGEEKTEGTDKTAIFELKIPREDMPDIPSDAPITITLTGDHGISDVTLVRKL